MSDERENGTHGAPALTAGDAAEPVGATSEATQQLQAEIALTRQRVASELDAIAERIKPENIKRRMVASLQDRAVAALDLARRNPVPVALALGAGFLLLIWRARSNRS
jgi:Protein of unknown function (DUF3618)